MRGFAVCGCHSRGWRGAKRGKKQLRAHGVENVCPLMVIAGMHRRHRRWCWAVPLFGEGVAVFCAPGRAL